MTATWWMSSTYILRRDGIEVTAAFDGQHAWERFQSEAPELVVLDITMPSMDGVELLRPACGRSRRCRW